MTLIDLINGGAAVLGGGIKGFCDGMEIDLQGLDYVLPAVGTLTLPTTLKLMNGDSPFFKNVLLAGAITGACYALGRSAAYIAKHYS